MSLLDALLKNNISRAPLATFATFATPKPETPQESRESQESQGGSVELSIYARLLALAGRQYLDTALVDRIASAELPLYADLPDAALVVVLAMLADSAAMEAGIVPAGDTGPILCRKCGPVWVHPAIAIVLPVVGGWPRALGCPWCFIRKDGRLAIPRPPVTCGSCRHFQPDQVNPQNGMGTCALGVPMKGRPHYPATTRQCGSWRTFEGTP